MVYNMKRKEINEEISEELIEDIKKAVKEMNKDDLDHLFDKFKALITAKENAKERDLDDDSAMKIIFSSALISFLAGGVMGSIYGNGVADFVSGAFVGTGVFTALIGSLMSGIYGKKPLANIKYHLKKKDFQKVLSEVIGKRVRNGEVNNSVYDYLSTLEDGAEKSTTESSPDKEI